MTEPILHRAALLWRALSALTARPLALACTLTLACLVTGLPARADEAPRQLTVSGQGEVHVVPDIAILSVGATIRAATARQALDNANATVRALLDKAQAMGIAERDIATRQIGVGPVYANRRSNDEMPTPSGFQANNTLEITIRDLPKAGAIIDAMSAAGANSIGGLQFAVSKADAHEDEARRLAVRDAMRRANLIAMEAGVTLGPILSIHEGGVSTPRPMLHAAMKESRAAIAPGETTIAASITVVYSLGE